MEKNNSKRLLLQSDELELPVDGSYRRKRKTPCVTINFVVCLLTCLATITCIIYCSWALSQIARTKSDIDLWLHSSSVSPSQNITQSSRIFMKHNGTNSSQNIQQTKKLPLNQKITNSETQNLNSDADDNSTEKLFIDFNDGLESLWGSEDEDDWYTDMTSEEEDPEYWYTDVTSEEDTEYDYETTGKRLPIENSDTDKRLPVKDTDTDNILPAEYSDTDERLPWEDSEITNRKMLVNSGENTNKKLPVGDDEISDERLPEENSFYDWDDDEDSFSGDYNLYD